MSLDLCQAQMFKPIYKYKRGQDQWEHDRLVITLSQKSCTIIVAFHGIGSQIMTHNEMQSSTMMSLVDLSKQEYCMHIKDSGSQFMIIRDSGSQTNVPRAASYRKSMRITAKCGILNRIHSALYCQPVNLRYKTALHYNNIQ